MIALLAEDVILQKDGGGKAIAMPNLVHGASNVARAIILGREKFRPNGDAATRFMSVHGAPGIVSYLDGKPTFVFTMDTNEKRIRAIYFITNPDKLSHLPELVP